LVDHHFASNWRPFAHFSIQCKDVSDPFNHYGNLATPNNAGPTVNTAKSVAVDNLYTINPTLFVNVRYGLNRKTNVRTPFSTGFDFTQLGFSPSIKAVADALEFPRFDVSGLSSLGQETFNDLGIFQTTHTSNPNSPTTYP